uniref:Uncharacterized protein n=1 Tax=Panagrellus redivivus TaxID=6233 RepID=A0A7E4VCE1_PANRE
MFKAVILCVALVGAFAENATGGAKEAVGKGYGNVYQGGYPQQGLPATYGATPPQQLFYGPPQQQAFYPPQQPIFPAFVNRNYDSHYCSVHASFALALTSNVASSPPASAPGNGGPYGAPQASPPQTAPIRSYSRQFCRYAAFNYDNCVACCKIAARVANTSPDNISAAIFSFDPLNPVANGAGIENNDPAPGQAAAPPATNNNGPYRKKRETEAFSTSVKQCVCCAPKQDF